MKIPPDIRQRDDYINRVIPFMNQQIIKVFTGQRRVGKSYLLFQIMQILKDRTENCHILYINKEDLSFSFIKDANDLNQYILQNKSMDQMTYVFIDEIQEISGFESALRSLLLSDDLDLYCTGSNASFLSGDIAGSLSGRYIEITVYSLSYKEFLLFHQLNDNDEALDYYLRLGGLPYLKHLQLKDDIVFEYVKNIYNTIVYRDVVNRFSVRNTTFLEQLIKFLASNTGSLFSSKKISDFLKSQGIKIPANQVQLYTQHLTDAFLIHKINRIFETGDKYYFENLGIRNSIWGYRPEDKGKILENAVCNHLLFKGYSLKVGYLDQREIDFIAEKAGEKHYFQVALSINDPRTLEREFGNLQLIQDNYPKTVITFDNYHGNTYEGISTLSLRQFLMQGVEDLLL